MSSFLQGIEERDIMHFQFLEWPMHRIPETGHIIDFRRRVRAYQAQTCYDGPIVVHCW